MGHSNAPLTPEGRRRLVERVDEGRPIAHVAAEAGISRRCLSKWYSRWKKYGDVGLLDQTSRPDRSPNRTADDVVELIVYLRRTEKWGPARIAATLNKNGVEIAAATVHRVLVREGLSRLRDMDPPTGLELRGAVVRYEHEAAGDMVHLDVKKIGKIPPGGGWRVHGRGTEEALASKRKGKGPRIGYTYLHSAIDDYSRLAYTEALENEKGDTAAAFWLRAAAFFAEHGIKHVERVLTDNGSCYRSKVFAAALAETDTKHRRTRAYSPKTNGKVERFNGTLAREWAYVRPYDSEEARRAALADFLNFYNHERPHSALGHQPPITRTLGSEFRITHVPDSTPPALPRSQGVLFDDG